QKYPVLRRYEGVRFKTAKDKLIEQNPNPKASIVLLDELNARSTAARIAVLNWRTRHRPVGTEHATLSLDGLHAMAAALAIVNVPTGVRRHGLKLFVAASRTSNDREQFHGSPRATRNSGLHSVAAPGSIRPRPKTMNISDAPCRPKVPPYCLTGLSHQQKHCQTNHT